MERAMSSQRPSPLFGLAIDPSTDEPQAPLAAADAADEAGLDLIGLMDHPYNPDHLETWTLLSMLADRRASGPTIWSSCTGSREWTPSSSGR